MPEAAARLRDLRLPSAKMGKSSARSGTMHLLDEPVRIAATVRAAVTDLDPMLAYDPELRPGLANLAELLGALTGRTPSTALAGLRGAGALKAAVTEALVETLRPIRARYLEFAADPANWTGGWPRIRGGGRSGSADPRCRSRRRRPAPR